MHTKLTGDHHEWHSRDEVAMSRAARLQQEQKQTDFVPQLEGKGKGKEGILILHLTHRDHGLCKFSAAQMYAIRQLFNWREELPLLP